MLLIVFLCVGATDVDIPRAISVVGAGRCGASLFLHTTDYAVRVEEESVDVANGAGHETSCGPRVGRAAELAIVEGIFVSAGADIAGSHWKEREKSID